MTRRFGRRAGLLALLAGLSACAQPEPPAPVVTAPADPEPERVYAPGPIAWADLSEEHKRRARATLTRMGEDAPDDDETLQARWMIMSPAQQRFMIRRPPPPRPPARGRQAPANRARTRAPAARTTAPPRRRTTRRPQ